MPALIRSLHGWIGHRFKTPKTFESGRGLARCWCGESLCVTE